MNRCTNTFYSLLFLNTYNACTLVQHGICTRQFLSPFSAANPFSKCIGVPKEKEGNGNSDVWTLWSGKSPIGLSENNFYSFGKVDTLAIVADFLHPTDVELGGKGTRKRKWRGGRKEERWKKETPPRPFSLTGPSAKRQRGGGVKNSDGGNGTQPCIGRVGNREAECTPPATYITHFC